MGQKKEGGKGKSMGVGLLIGAISTAVAAIFLTKKENREKVKGLVSKDKVKGLLRRKDNGKDKVKVKSKEKGKSNEKEKDKERQEGK